ncbi:hypothetical protein EVAR_32671_1 [Eumeta japonica]|uniref:Uncharacterized protein n=1 Tax=Eumeta variegata TaxID=151549 RepID=A0A4C1VR14_EUMVA|nr:hypothetical protein EVAR_32671_1 [Eumeta japonica]
MDDKIDDVCELMKIRRLDILRDAVTDDNVTETENMIDDGNESQITVAEIMKTLGGIKVGKAAGCDRVSSEMLRSVGDIVASLLYQHFNKCWKSHRALQSLYSGSSACVRMNGAYTDWFDIRRGVGRGCIASP